MKCNTTLYARDNFDHGNGIIIENRDQFGLLINTVSCEDGTLLFLTDVEIEQLFIAER